MEGGEGEVLGHAAVAKEVEDDGDEAVDGRGGGVAECG